MKMSKILILLCLCLNFILTKTNSVSMRSSLHKFMDNEELQFYFGTNLISSLPDYEIVDLPESLWSGRESVTANADEDDSKYVNFKVFNKQVELNLFPNKYLISPYTRIVKKSGNKTLNKYYANSKPKFCHYIHNNNYSTAAISNCERTEIHGLIFLPDDSFEILPLTTRLKSLMPENLPEDATRSTAFTKIPHLVKKSKFTMGTFENDFIVTNFRRPSGKKPQNKNKNKRERGIDYDRPTVELGLFFDEEFYKIFSPFFDDDEKKLEDFILSYINGVQSLYHHHSLGRKIDLTIVYLEIMEKQPHDMPHAYGERNELLDNFCDYQKKINPKDDRDPQHYDMSVYVSGLDFFAWDKNNNKNGVTMGLATVSGVCQENYNCLIAEFGTNNQFGRPYPSAGFTSVYILAHEIGHNLGMNHDATDNSCSKEGYVMSPSRGTQGETTWSSCSASVMRKLDWAKCLFDTPSVTKYDAWKHHGKPGISYTAKDQCEILLRDRDAIPFINGQESTLCENLHCRTPNRSGFYFAGPALPGTDCGKGKWCDGGQCVTKNLNSLTSTTSRSTTKATKATTSVTTQKPAYKPTTKPVSKPTIKSTVKPASEPTPIPYMTNNCKSPCLKASKGVQPAIKSCIKGSKCDGTLINLEICDDRKLCSARKTVVEYGTQKCREFSRKLNNVDSKGLGLQAYYEPLRLWMPCTIFCKHKNNTSYFTPRVELNKLGIDGYFPDGTWCHREGNVDYYCLHHHCLPQVK
ncbi:hypothetical protein ACKWTF_001110 [Chironomus riparius]